MRTSIILFLNKVDLFRQKLGRSPLSNYFPDYSGGNDINRASKYLLWRFNQVNRAHLNLYPQLVAYPGADVPEANTQQSHTSHRYIKYQARVRRCEGDDPPKCPQRFWYSLS
jgi:hypothetical protein